MKNKFILGLVLMVLSLAGIVSAVEDTTSRYSTGGATSSVLFDAIPDYGWTVKSVDPLSDVSTGKVTFQGRLVTTPISKVTAIATNAATVIYMTPTTGIASNDTVYAKATATSPGFVATVTAATSSNITVSASIPNALAVGDPIFEINTISVMAVGSNTLAAVNYTRTSEGGLVRTQGNSPLRATITATTSNELSVCAVKEKR